MPQLKRVLRLRDVLIFGIGIIIGAGIYSIIGKVAGIAGYGTWLSVILAGILSMLTGLSFAEMASIYPDTSSYYKLIRDAFKIFGGKIWGFLVQWSLLVTSIFVIATVAIAFGGYLSKFIPLNESILSLFLIVVSALLAFFGIKESVNTTLFLTFLAVFGLVFVIVLGLFLAKPSKEILLNFEFGSNIFYATSLIFFAYAGFHLIPAESEETHAPKELIPKAIVLSILISMIIYTLVSIAVINLLDINLLAISKAPLYEAVSERFGKQAGSLVWLSAIFATSSTVLGLIISGSRLLYSFGKERLFPKVFSRLSKFKTPSLAIGFISLAAFVAVFLIKDLKVTADITNFLTLFCYYLVNVSIILLRVFKPKIPRGFKVPFSIKNIPLPSLIASIFCFALLTQFPVYAIFDCFLIFFLGIVFYFIVREKYIV